MTKRDTLDLTLDERATFESLLAEYANAEMDVVRAIGRRHDAMHAVHNFVNNRTGQLATESYHEGIAYGNEVAFTPNSATSGGN